MWCILPRKQLRGQLRRGFESLSLRQINFFIPMRNNSKSFYMFLIISAILILKSVPSGAVSLQPGIIEEDNIKIVEVKALDGKEGLIAEMKVKGTINRTWEVMTDYNSLPDFIPDLKISKVLNRRENEIIVYQEGESEFLMFKFRVGVTVKIVEHHHNRVEFTKVNGDFDFLEGEWRVEPLSSNETLIVFTVAAKPKLYIPRWVIRYIMKRAIPVGMKALQERIER